MKNLWKDCLLCKMGVISFPLFATSEEENRLSDINKRLPCAYYDCKTKLCTVHEKRPIDCQIFPFDVFKKNNKFYWMIWKINCFISNKKDFEPYLQEYEKNIILIFKNYLDSYSRFQHKEFRKIFRYKLLREIKL